mmetsp:Transcript_21543/g.31888  ORF Transcript_21543/g.31888 Transcript_21543/m.31888 type:complete len:82 (+) Transcript_21543:250-495(+)
MTHDIVDFHDVYCNLSKLCFRFINIQSLVQDTEHVCMAKNPRGRPLRTQNKSDRKVAASGQQGNGLGRPNSRTAESVDAVS